jgi:hypothetical protein
VYPKFCQFALQILSIIPVSRRAALFLASGAANVRRLDSYNERIMRRILGFLLFCYLVTIRSHAEGPVFDLTGPKVDVHVKRGDLTLPISQVPNLLPGDRLWIHPDLPESQSAHFVLVVAFLRGSTNPPPNSWFTRVETWSREARTEGVFVTIPADAQQALLFLAPETGGDFNTLRKAVHDRPGAFIRAAQDLQAASWDRMRVETFLEEVRFTSQTDPTALKEHAELAARSLGIKLDHDCFERPTDQQVSCLSRNSSGMVLDDSKTESLVAQLTAGSTQDLMNQLSSSHIGGGGAYSPYIGAIVDTAKILSSLHTAHFQYIPSLAMPTSDTLNLRLNTPPSFRNPKSVVMVALPPLGPAKAEPLHPVVPTDQFCAQKPGLVLPAQGAPMVFASQLIHDLYVHISAKSEIKSVSFDLQVAAESAKGGLVLKEPVPELPPGDLIATVRGKWGFDDWTGPQYHLVSSQAGGWTLAGADQSALVVGRDDTLHFEGQSTLCVERVEAHASAVGTRKLTWRSLKPGSLEVSLPMKDASPGPVTVYLYAYGVKEPETLSMMAYADAASLDSLKLSAGDSQAMLKGTRLDEVAKAEFNGITFTPSALTRVEDRDQLIMQAAASTASLEPGNRYTAGVQLKDGRMLKAPVTVDAPRPQATLLSKGVQQSADQAPSPVQLGSPDDLPLDGRLVFFLKSTVPARFPRDQKVELSSVDGSFKTQLSLSDGSLMLEDATTAMASIEPLARFGGSAFGPLHVRVLSADGATGDWMPFGTLVRVPGFKELRCPRAATKPCLLTGTNMFLASSLSATQDFENPIDIAPDFTGTQVVIPHPTNGVLYLKLRDDPVTVQTLTLTVTPAPAGFSEALAPGKSKSAATPDDSTVPTVDQPASGPTAADPGAKSAPAAKSTSPQ